MKYSIGLLFLMVLTARAQQVDLPADFLSSDFHKGRRDLVREQLPKNSVAVFFANPVRNRSNDVDYVYHQDPNFYYLTGHSEPHAVLLIFKELQRNSGGKKYHEIVFVQPRDARAEMWTGRRLGQEGAREKLEIQKVSVNTEFETYTIDFSKFDKVLFYDFESDVRDTRVDGDLYDLIAWFKEKVHYPSDKFVALEAQPQNIDLLALDEIMTSLRGVKTSDELDLLKKAVDISCIAQREVMKAIKPGMSEREVQGIHEFVFKKYQAEYEGYPSIVGAGHNGCILHYIENYKPEINSDEMILMDLGAEYHGYTADVTRTIPIDGVFSEEEKAIYDLVYAAQQAAFEACKPGVSIRKDLNEDIVKKIINEGLVELGILNSADEPHLYYPHGLGHHIGLDVHDKGQYEYLEPNMAITIEPGIYIPHEADCDEKWWGIAVRIEDDFLVTEEGCELLSDMVPRRSDEIELLMQEPSPLDGFVLPSLDRE